MDLEYSRPVSHYSTTFPCPLHCFQCTYFITTRHLMKPFFTLFSRLLHIIFTFTSLSTVMENPGGGVITAWNFICMVGGKDVCLFVWSVDIHGLAISRSFFLLGRTPTHTLSLVPISLIVIFTSPYSL